MELNGTVNFSLQEAYGVLLESMGSDRNLDSHTEMVLVTVYGALMAVGLLANLAVGLVVAGRPRLRTARNLYVANLAVSDMTLCAVCMPFTLIAIVRRRWSLGVALCKLVPLAQGTNIMVSVGTITVIAVDRYSTIVRGGHHGSEGGTGGDRRRVAISIALVWALSALTTLPVVFYQVVEPLTFSHVVLYETCIERWPSQTLRVSYTASVLLVQAVIPALVVGVVHARIASYLHQHAQTQKDSRRAKRELQRNRKTTMLLSGVAVLFAVSWLPLGVFTLTADLLFPPGADPNPASARQLYLTLAACHALAMSSAVSNPVVYGWLNTNIRQELLQLLPASCSSLAQPTAGDDPTTRHTSLALLHKPQTMVTNATTTAQL
ncbi:neuropeptide F receptor [Nilaparvata lugens]|uniref:neuropeptide F receptor n=1 Tax=Nilaparvata lugens TaxID=108931 RepID=UPI00193D0D02|nr:neuropeptide F receptor [Nilaparvata lugens]